VERTLSGTTYSYIVTFYLDCTWVRDLTIPMHLGLNNGPLVPNVALIRGDEKI